MSYPDEQYLQRSSLRRMTAVEEPQEEREYAGMDFDWALGAAGLIGGILSVMTLAILFFASAVFAQESYGSDDLNSSFSAGAG